MAPRQRQQIRDVRKHAARLSATGLVNASGVLQMTMPCSAAAARSKESMPVPHLLIHCCRPVHALAAHEQAAPLMHAP